MQNEKEEKAKQELGK